MIGRIYKIVHLQSDVYYIGMTINSLSKRWSSYKADYNKDNYSKVSIYPYMIKYGFENFKILLIKEYNVVDKQHLKVFETLWINKLNPINKVASFNPLFKGTFKKRYYANYYEINKDSIKEKVRKYANDNKDKIRERGVLYREKNNEIIKAKKGERFNCKCGGSWNKGHGFNRHFKTKKHQDFLRN